MKFLSKFKDSHPRKGIWKCFWIMTAILSQPQCVNINLEAQLTEWHHSRSADFININWSLQTTRCPLFEYFQILIWFLNNANGNLLAAIDLQIQQVPAHPCKPSNWKFRHPLIKSTDTRSSFAMCRQWTSYQIRKIAGCACAGNAGNVFPATTI